MAAEAIQTFNRLGLKVIVVSNQPAIAKGKMSEELFEKVRLKMKTLLELKGAHVDAEYYCFHHPTAKLAKYKSRCDCRKPEPGLLLRAAKDFGLDLSKCYMIGDGVTDVKVGRVVGCRSILIGDLKCDLCRLMEKYAVKPDIVVSSLLHASAIIGKEVANKKVEPDVVVCVSCQENKITEKEVVENGNIH